MALFKQDRDGRARGRADAAGGAGDEDGFLRHDFLLVLTSKMNNERERCLPSTRFDYYNRMMIGSSRVTGNRKLSLPAVISGLPTIRELMATRAFELSLRRGG